VYQDKYVCTEFNSLKVNVQCNTIIYLYINIIILLLYTTQNQLDFIDNYLMVDIVFLNLFDKTKCFCVLRNQLGTNAKL